MHVLLRWQVRSGRQPRTCLPRATVTDPALVNPALPRPPPTQDTKGTRFNKGCSCVNHTSVEDLDACWRRFNLGPLDAVRDFLKASALEWSGVLWCFLVLLGALVIYVWRCTLLGTC